jgi:hypothetical protein
LLGQWPVTPLPAPERRAPRETSQVLLVPWLLISLQFVPFALLPRYIRMQPVPSLICSYRSTSWCALPRERGKRRTRTRFSPAVLDNRISEGFNWTIRCYFKFFYPLWVGSR